MSSSLSRRGFVRLGAAGASTPLLLTSALSAAGQEASDVTADTILGAAEVAGLELGREEAEAIYKLTSLCTAEERFVIPPSHREEAIELTRDTMDYKQAVGFGFLSGPKRGL